MSVSPVDSSTQVTPTAEVQFNAAVDKSKSQMSEDELTEALVNQAVTVGGQFIIMPKAQEMLNEAQSSEDDEE
ncbi:hypothetical protein ACXX81_13060 [Pseudomonas sp. GNP013]